ncbi:hypothetical protein FQA39_LY03242 [Lamprigera yunnana]|nr:hypothetical protein FQA39_LY03242 [Lamprigera yunnana]
MLLGEQNSKNYSRKPQILADAAYWILTQNPKPTGQFFIDDEVILKAGITDLDQYACNPKYKDELYLDAFVDVGDSPTAAFTVPLLRKETSSKSAPAANDGSIAGIMKSLESTLNPKLVEKTQAVFQFVVTGKEASTWYLDLKSGSGSCGVGEAPTQADATLTMDSKHFVDMFNGKTKPAMAFMTGKLKIAGNMQKALKLDKLMGMIDTAAVHMLLGEETSKNHSRKPQILADAAYWILTQNPKPTGQFFIDDEVILKAGITDLDQYACNPKYKDELYLDAFVDVGDSPTAAFTETLLKKETSSKPAPAANDGSIAGIMKSLESTLNPKLVEKTQAVFQFVVTGKEASTWYLDLKSGSGSCGVGEAPTQADATLTMDSKHFVDMFNGKTKPAMAFMTGKLKIAGNMQKALKLDKLMGSLKAKL